MDILGMPFEYKFYYRNIGPTIDISGLLLTYIWPAIDILCQQVSWAFKIIISEE